MPRERGLRCVFHAADAEFTAAAFDAAPDLVIFDLDFLADRSRTLLDAVQVTFPSARVIAVTREPSTEPAVRALTAGTADCFVLPAERDLLRSAIGADRRGPARARSVADLAEIVTADAGMRDVLDAVRRAIDSATPAILVRGEAGTGKELVARSIHYGSERAAGPFAGIDAAALPDPLLEAELFGYEADAFADARAARQGLLAPAEAGTLLIDEPFDASLDLQARLLDAIEGGRFRRIGGHRDVEVRARLVIATRRDLEAALDRGILDARLYAALAGSTIALPPLRERGSDAELLAERFVERAARRHGREARPLAEDARAMIGDYRWPGNVRELKNAIERAALLGEGPEITAADLQRARRRDRITEAVDRLVVDVPPEGLVFDEYERRVVERALARNGWNRSRTARELSISRPRLARMIERHGLRPPPEL